MSIMVFIITAFIAGVFIKCGAYALKVGIYMLWELIKKI